MFEDLNFFMDAINYLFNIKVDFNSSIIILTWMHVETKKSF